MVRGPETSVSTGKVCATCGLPNELCVCDSLSSAAMPLTVRLATRRYGKAVTVIEGFDDDATAKAIGKELKHALATGGTAKDRHVELQGDQSLRVRRWLEERGYAVY